MTEEPIGRIQFSKQGISLYNYEGGFVCRIEHPSDRRFFVNWIGIGLGQLAEAQKRRSGGAIEGAAPEVEAVPI